MPKAPETGAAWLSADDARLLSDIGFVAASSGQTRQAVQIFQSLTLVRPMRAFPYLGLALTHLNAKDAAAAVSALALGRRVLGDWSAPLDAGHTDQAEHAEDLAMLGVFTGIAAHADQRRAEGFQHLRQALQEAPPEGPAARLARSLLGLAGEEPDLAPQSLASLARPA